MLTVSTLILFLYFIIWPVHGQSLTKEQVEPCRQQTAYNIPDSPSVKMALYYDVDKTELDFEFVAAMCKAHTTLTKAVTYEFYPGVSTKVNKDGLVECYHKDKTNKDCTDSFAAACASQLVDDFPAFVCCTAGQKTASDCVKDKNPNKLNEFDQCVKQLHPTIKPDQILLANADAAKGVYSSFDCFPIMSFNGKLDACARYVFAADKKSVEVICSILVENSDPGCNK